MPSFPKNNWKHLMEKRKKCSLEVDTSTESWPRTRPRIAPSPSSSPEWKQSSSNWEVFNLLEDLRKKELWRVQAAKQGRLSNRSAQKKTKPIFKGINSLYGRLLLYLRDANVVGITTTMLKKKFRFFKVTSQIPLTKLGMKQGIINSFKNHMFP